VYLMSFIGSTYKLSILSVVVFLSICCAVCHWLIVNNDVGL